MIVSRGEYLKLKNKVRRLLAIKRETKNLLEMLMLTPAVSYPRLDEQIKHLETLISEDTSDDTGLYKDTDES